MKLFLGFLALLPLVVDFAAERPYEPVKIIWFEVAVIIAIAAALAAAFRRRVRLADLISRLNGLDAAVTVYFAALAVGSACSVDPVRSFWGSEERLTGLLFYACLLAAYFVARFGAKRDDWDLFLRISVISSFAVSVYGIFQWFGYDFTGLGRAFPLYGQTGPMRAFATLGHPVFLGNYLAMTVPFALVFATQPEKGKVWRVFAALASVLAVLAIALSYSRGAWIASIAGFVAYFMMWKPRTRRFYSLAAASVTLSAIVVFSVLFAVRPQLIASDNSFAYRVGSALSLSEGSGLTRFGDARFALSLIAARPLTGYGLDTFMLYAVLRPKDAGERNRDWIAADPSVSDRVHNLELDTAWNGGLLALAALAFLIFSAAATARRSLHGKDRVFVAALTACLVAYFVSEQLAFDFSVVTVVAWLALSGLSGSSEV